MPAIKVTMLFQQATNFSNTSSPARRVAGWSESWYSAGTDIQRAIRNTVGAAGRSGPGLCEARAGLLCKGASIVGQRFQQVDPKGPSQSLNKTYGGWDSSIGDIPQMSILYRVPSTDSPNIRRGILRGIPDAAVVEGELATYAAWYSWLPTYYRALQFFTFRGRDLTAPAVKILDIDETGLVNCEVAHTYALNDMVRILRTLDERGIFQGGRFQIDTLGPGAVKFKVRNWTFGKTTGGTVRKDGIVYPTIDWQNITTGRVITRKVGRPSGQYRGRVSSRT